VAYSYVLPAEQSSSGAAKRWLLAYIVAQLACFGAVSAVAEATRALAWPADSYEQMGLTAAVVAICGLTFGCLRGNVLRYRLAAFRMLHFCAAVTIVSFFFSIPMPGPVSGLIEAGNNPQTTMRLLMPVILAGLGYGLVVGVAEAFTMRRAAFGLFTWVAMSGIAWAGGLTVATLATTYASALSLSTIQAVLIAIACAVLQALITGLLMLPALRMLTPRLSYYGPRVFRPLLRRPDRSEAAS